MRRSGKVDHERRITCDISNMDMFLNNKIRVEGCTKQKDRLTNNREVIEKIGEN